MDAEERWERIGQGLFWTGVIFVGLTVYGIFDGDDIRGLVMTVAPGALCFALWQLVSMRIESLVYGDAGGSRLRRLVSGVLFAIGALAIAAGVLLHTSH